MYSKAKIKMFQSSRGAMVAHQVCTIRKFYRLRLIPRGSVFDPPPNEIQMPNPYSNRLLSTQQFIVIWGLRVRAPPGVAFLFYLLHLTTNFDMYFFD